jgi:alkylation response protein AidB-like acyl-CoA dehydrogenase
MLIPATDAQIIDVWHVSGLRGTGSDDFAVADYFVPEQRAARMGDERARRQPGQLYLFPMNNVYATGFASVALGIARGALDAFEVLAREKTPRGTQRTLRDNAVVQLQVAEAEAHLRSARAWLHETLHRVWDEVARTKVLTLDHRIHIRLAATHAIHRAAHVVDTAYLAAGATAIFERNPFERRFRDIHAVTQQVQGRLAHFETAGQFFLGLEPDTQWL